MRTLKDLKDLENVINHELNVVGDDVPARIDPHANEIRMLSKLSLDIIDAKWEEMLHLGRADKLKKSSVAFRTLFDNIKTNINQCERWTFWHYFGLCMVTSIAYAHCLEKGYNKTIPLKDQRNWNERRVEVAILGLHYFAGVLYPNAIGHFNTLIKRDNYDMETIAKHLNYRLNKFV